MNILILIENFYSTGGAALTMLEFANSLLDHQVFTCCRNLVDVPANNKILQLKGEDLPRFVEEKAIQLIHYFKSDGLFYFNEIIENLKLSTLKVPIITTVCQKPSFESCALTLNEITNSTKIIFIDRAAYNDKVYFYIKPSLKRLIYFGFSSEIINETNNIKKYPHDSVVFGCGCTLNKLYEGYIDIYDKIECPDKKLVYVGASENSWIEEKALNRKDIEIYPLLENKLWQNMCKDFDIFLYLLSPETYSSIDGNLGLAMLYEIPPIVYGPPAPKERIVHGVNGFVAKTEKDIVKYAGMLIHDVELRKSIGKKARASTIENFTMKKTVELYVKLYNEVLEEELNVKNVFLIRLLYLSIYKIKDWNKMLIAKRDYIKRKMNRLGKKKVNIFVNRSMKKRFL